MKDSPWLRLRFGQWCVLLLVAGSTFLLTQNFNRVLRLFAKYVLNLRPYAGSVAAISLVVLGFAGLCWKRARAFFPRWSHNKQVIFLDALLFGAAIGVGLNSFGRGFGADAGSLAGWSLHWELSRLLSAECSA